MACISYQISAQAATPCGASAAILPTTASAEPDLAFGARKPVQHEVEPRELAATWLVRRGVRPELAPLVAELWGLGGRAA